MKTAFNLPRLACTVLASGFLVVLSASARAGGAPHNVWRADFSTATLVSEVSVPGVADGCPIESADGLSLLLASNRPGTTGGNDIWAADRASVSEPWGVPRNLGAPINSPSADFCPTPVYGRSLLFVSDRPGDGTGPTPCGGGDIYISRQSPAGGWSAPKMLKCASEGGPNFPGAERSPSLVQTYVGTFLFYSSTGNGTQHDIYVSRMDRNGEFGPGHVVTELSTEFDDIMPNVREREDGSFEIVFASNRPTWGHGQAAFGQQDIYYSRAYWPMGGWSEPRNLGATVNTAGVEQRSTLSKDGKRLYFGRDGDIYMSTRSGRQ